jgi:hypothetical protein
MRRVETGGVIQLCRKIITRVTSKINPAAGFCVELRRLSTKKVTNVIFRRTLRLTSKNSKNIS